MNWKCILEQEFGIHSKKSLRKKDSEDTSREYKFNEPKKKKKKNNIWILASCSEF